MSWTDERVEVLKKLWMDGLSASQIAGQLGQGVTRNAVIGKVHRLKLSARAKPATSTPRSRPANRPVRRAGTSASSGGGGASAVAAMKRRNMQSAPIVGATALKQSQGLAVNTAPAAEVEEVFIPVADRIGLLGLNEDTCKWPIGDPLNDDFHFCGQHSQENKPYCEFHSRRAYHTIDRRKR